VLTEPGLAGIVAAVKEGRTTFERILSYTLNSITKKTVQVLFLAVGLLMTGHAILTPFLMVLIMIAGDFLGMSLTTDNVRPSPMPNAWQIGNLTIAGAAMGIGELVYCTSMLAFGAYRMEFNIDALRTLAFVVIVFGNQATLYTNRERRHLWSSRPSFWLAVSSVADIAIASTLAVGGIAMTPLPALVVAGTLAAAAAFALVLDLVKVPVFARLGIAQFRAPVGSPEGGQFQSAEMRHQAAAGWVSTHWRIPAAAVALVVLAFGGGGGWLYWSTHRTAAVQSATQKIELGSIVRTVTASGVVVPTATAPVGARVSGVIDALYCATTTKVKAGQICAKIDPRPYQTVVDQGNADLAAAADRLEKDKANLAHAKAAFERHEALLKRRAISRKALDNSRKAYEQAQTQSKFDDATVARLEAALQAAEINLGYTDIVSPLDGTVVSRNVEVGQTVVAGIETPLFLVAADLSVMQVNANVSKNDIGGVKLGDKASFTVESLPNHPFTGEVTQIGPSLKTYEHVTTYDVVFSAPNPDLLLKPGMTATIRIVINRRDDILRAPDPD